MAPSDNINNSIFDHDLLQGVGDAAVENDPIGVAVGITAGQAAASAETDPIIVVVGIASGGSDAASAETDGIGVAAAQPAGQSLTAAEHDPEGDDVAFPSGQSSVAAINAPLGQPFGIAAGVAAASAENDPTASEQTLATPVGVSAVASENDPTASATGSQAGVLGGRRRLKNLYGGIQPYAIGEIPIHATALVGSLHIVAKSNNPSATGTAIAAVFKSATVIKFGEITAKGIRNPSDEEWISILAEIA